MLIKYTIKQISAGYREARETHRGIRKVQYTNREKGAIIYGAVALFWEAVFKIMALVIGAVAIIGCSYIGLSFIFHGHQF